MDAGGSDSSRHSSNIAVIHEIYDNEESPQCFSIELEKALEQCRSIIIIEPSSLGDETARWIKFGNYLHKTAVISGITSIISGFVWPDNFTVQGPLSILSTLCTGLYTASWQFDHCVKYQVERDPSKVARLQAYEPVTSSPVVLVRKDDMMRKILHCTATLTAAALCIYRLYRTVR